MGATDDKDHPHRLGRSSYPVVLNTSCQRSGSAGLTRPLPCYDARRGRETSLDRRSFIAGLGGAAAWPLVARAQQQPDKVWRVGYLSPSSANNFSVPFFDDFR